MFITYSLHEMNLHEIFSTYLTFFRTVSVQYSVFQELRNHLVEIVYIIF